MTIIRDHKGRDMIRIGDNGKMAIARRPDYSDEIKEYIIAVYKEVSSEDPQKIRDFLDYKSEENEFCV